MVREGKRPKAEVKKWQLTQTNGRERRVYGQAASHWVEDEGRWVCWFLFAERNRKQQLSAESEDWGRKVFRVAEREGVR